MQPCADLLRRALAGPAPAPPAAGFLAAGLRKDGENDYPASQQLENLAAVEVEGVGRARLQFVTFRFEGNHFRASCKRLAAISTASRMRGYVPQRQTLPCIAWTISGRVGFALPRSSATPDRIIPEVQYPHCIEPTSRNASCKGCSRPLLSRPSMVVICRPAAARSEVMQDRVATPSMSTVQAPHWPSPQPYLLPVRSRSSRRTLSRLRSGSASVLTLSPLIRSSVFLGIEIPQSRPIRV